MDIPLGIGIYTSRHADFVPLDERNLKILFTQFLIAKYGRVPLITKLDYYCKGFTMQGKTLLTAKYYFVRGPTGVEVFLRRKRKALYRGDTLTQAKDWAIHREKKQHDRERRIKENEQKYKPP